jgi:cytochrome b
MILVGVSLAGVLFSNPWHRENLIRSMLTGCKRAE